jgi:hypothetical protein
MKRTPLKRKSPLKKQGKKRAVANKLYSVKRRDFLYLRPICEVWVELANTDTRASNLLKEAIFDEEISYRPVYSDDVHHKEGRAGERFLDESTWMAVSRKAHSWIHAHPKQAREMGWLK